MKKRYEILYEYSNAILIFLTLLTLLVLINLFPKSIIDTSQRILKLRQVQVKAFTSGEGNQLVMDVQKIENVINEFDVHYSGKSGKEFDIIINLVNWTLDEYSKSDNVEKNSTLVKTCQKQITNMIDAYLGILHQRFHAFDYLFYLFSVGIVLQFIYIIIMNKKSLNALKTIKVRDQNLFDLQRIREDERKKIASLLHDSILQDLGSILMLPEFNESEEVRERMESTISQLRNITYSTAPLQLYNLGLDSSIQDLIINFKRQTGLDVKYQVGSLEDITLSDDVLLIFFRIVQESMNNIRKYAQATNIKISIIESYPFLLLMIKDDGIGFDLEKQKSKASHNKHYGLLLMEQQAQSINGEFKIISAPNEGTIVKMKYNLSKGDIDE